MTSIRVLVVDDYAPFRRFVCLTLERRPDLQVVGEAPDGLEAVQKTGELQVDLIVLDIGLPKLNGIEAARRIRKHRPDCKILFLSQESSGDVVQEALSLGALGYVVKSRAGSELLAAVDAVCQGKQFVSRGISNHDCTGAVESQVTNPHLSKQFPSPAPGKGTMERSHAAEFYSDDASFVVGFAHFIEAALNAGNAVIAVVTESHLNNLLQRLRAQGVNISAAIEQGRFIGLDVAEILSTFMVNDLPDPARFFRVVGDLIASLAAGEHSRVAICGECGSTLWAQGNADAAILVEQLCNQLTKRYGMNVLCGFSLSSFYREEDKQLFHRICANAEP